VLHTSTGIALLPTQRAGSASILTGAGSGVGLGVRQAAGHTADPVLSGRHHYTPAQMIPSLPRPLRLCMYTTYLPEPLLAQVGYELMIAPVLLRLLVLVALPLLPLRINATRRPEAAGTNTCGEASRTAAGSRLSMWRGVPGATCSWACAHTCVAWRQCQRRRSHTGGPASAPGESEVHCAACCCCC
jgi:hypothetical protein